MKLLLIVLFVVSSCTNTTIKHYEIDAKQENQLLKVVSILNDSELRGSVNTTDKVVRNGKGEIIDQSLPDSLYLISEKYGYTRIVNRDDFTYFVMDGFKGTNYGILLSEEDTSKLDGFYDIKLIRRTSDNRKAWYFVSSKQY